MMCHVFLILLALLVAIVIGLVLARVMSRRYPTGPFDYKSGEWLKVKDVVSLCGTLVALLLAFMLVQTFGSYQRAETHSATEAGVVDAQYQAAGLLGDQDRDAIRGDLACYARSISELEWVTMRDDESSPTVDGWRDQLQADISAAAETDPDRLSLSDLVVHQNDLTGARDERLAEVEPAIPQSISWLIEITTLMVLILLISFTWHFRRLPRLMIITTVALLYLLLVGGIRELDTPFSGAVHIAPTRMHDTIARMDSSGDAAAMPCDADGVPTA
jgi:hypothetical protein